MHVLVISALKRFDKPLTLRDNHFGADNIDDVANFIKNYKTQRRMTHHEQEDIQRCSGVSTFQRFWETGP
jgi:hypothetical protein